MNTSIDEQAQETIRDTITLIANTDEISDDKFFDILYPSSKTITLWMKRPRKVMIRVMIRKIYR